VIVRRIVKERKLAAGEIVAMHSRKDFRDRHQNESGHIPGDLLVVERNAYVFGEVIGPEYDAAAGSWRSGRGSRFPPGIALEIEDRVRTYRT
jgi:hypothetical protein